MTEPLIRVDGLTKDYVLGDNVVHALAGVSMTIDAGEFVAVMGPSGSGKSTFMNMIGCLDRPTSGSYWIAGEDAARMNADDLAAVRNRRIGFVFQQFNLLARTSALENVELPLMYANVPMQERHARALDKLKLVGLGERSDHQPNQLSGGQQQRVAIARALVNDPALILADEPTGALDSRTSVEIMALLQQLNARRHDDRARHARTRRRRVRLAARDVPRWPHRVGRAPGADVRRRGAARAGSRRRGACMTAAA